MKNVPKETFTAICHAIQELIPAFLSIWKAEAKNKGSKAQAEITNSLNQSSIYLETIKKLLQQAYFASFNHEILVVIDRMLSLEAFENYLVETDESQRSEYYFYTTQLVRDAEPWYRQGGLYLEMNKQNKLKLGQQHLKEAARLFITFDDIENLKLTQEALKKAGLN